MDKRGFSERDICTKFIAPALERAGWDRQTQFLEEYQLTDGRIHVRGSSVKRDTPKRADYILFYKPNIPVAVIEAKDNSHTVGQGMQQALTYADMLDVPLAYSTNGDAFLQHDATGQSMQVETEIPLDAFPSPEELWRRYCIHKGIEESHEPIITHDYYVDASGKKPRYYQINAINRTLDAISKGQDRILLVMATGTGKTYVAFQTIWRLWKARAKKRILFLADRNILVDQARINDFKPFGSAMTKIKKRQIDKSFEIYLCLYQAVTGSEEEKNVYKQFSRNFFDLVVIDECHRGSAAEDSAWREILDYFTEAAHIGLTATPKETKDISNIEYFGDPLYTYSLRQGINDGFLAPYKVVRIDIDKDLFGYRPPDGKLDDRGNVIEDRIYNLKDWDKNMVLAKRTELVARKVTEFLQGTNRFDKTIVFCEDIDHADRMRQALVNANPDLSAENSKYIVKITGDDKYGKAELDNFIDPEQPYPVIATTSQLLNTGVDAQTCKLIVLDQNIQSMPRFKQIIGRGTRIKADYDKFFFTIMDFRKATELFADPDFDGPPIQIYEPGPDESPVPPEEPEPDPPEEATDPIPVPEPPDGPLPPEADKKRVKYYVGDVPVQVIAERVQYIDQDGKLITESLKDYSRRNILDEYDSLDAFLATWTAADKKKAILDELVEHGVFLDELAAEVGNEYDLFDLICHVAFDQPPLTRRERAENVRKNNYFTRYGEQARAVLNALLDKYADEGIEHIENIDILKVRPLSEFGTPIEILNLFGGRAAYQQAIKELEQQLYHAAYRHKRTGDIFAIETDDAGQVISTSGPLFGDDFNPKMLDYDEYL